MVKIAYFVEYDNSTQKYETEFRQPGSAFIEIAIKDEASLLQATQIFYEPLFMLQVVAQQLIA